MRRSHRGSLASAPIAPEASTVVAEFGGLAATAHSPHTVRVASTVKARLGGTMVR